MPNSLFHESPNQAKDDFKTTEKFQNAFSCSNFQLIILFYAFIGRIYSTFVVSDKKQFFWNET